MTDESGKVTEQYQLDIVEIHNAKRSGASVARATRGLQAQDAAATDAEGAVGRVVASAAVRLP